MGSRTRPSREERGCAICGDTPTEGCHVRARRTFEESVLASERDRTRNIVRLCAEHHELMDDGWVAISPNGTEIVFRKGGAKIKRSLGSRLNVATEYIEWRNEYSEFWKPFDD